MSERWLPIPGFEDRYEVSDHGRVRSRDRVITDRNGVTKRLKGILRKQFPDRKGYMQLSLRHPENPRTWAKVHQLVLEAFVGPCPPGYMCCHANDIPADNRLENLRWDTPSANMFDRVRNGNDHNARKIRCPQGHEYTPENTRILANGGRRCRICIRAQNMEWQRNNPEKASAKAARYRERRRSAA